jgi:hypothetical protein
MVKREYTDEEEEVKETYIWLSCTLAVVTSAQLAVYTNLYKFAKLNIRSTIHLPNLADYL